MYYDINESGKRLSELRKMRGLTQQQVADELGSRILYRKTCRLFLKGRSEEK